MKKNQRLNEKVMNAFYLNFSTLTYVPMFVPVFCFVGSKEKSFFKIFLNKSLKVSRSG